jgi:leader peptidase (prepilin peptidase) / N-methyltransferase
VAPSSIRRRRLDAGIELMIGMAGATLLAAATMVAGVPAGWAAAKIARAYAEAPDRSTTIATIPAMVLTFGWAAATTPFGPILIASLVLGWTLVALAAVDLLSFRLPDPLTLPLVTVGLAGSFLLPGAPVLDHVAGAGAGYALLAALRWAFERLRGREGIGLGDAKLLAAAGAWLGWRPLPSVLLIACCVAFVWIGFGVVLRGQGVLRERLAFGAPLCLAIWIVWLYGPLTGNAGGYST